MGKSFTLDPAHANFVPGHSKLNNPMLLTLKERLWHSGWIWYLVVVIPCSLMSIWLSLGAIVQQELAYRNDGITTTATVVDCEREVSGGRYASITMHLTYSYVVNNAELLQTETIFNTNTLCENIPEQVTIEYLGQNPSFVRLIDERVATPHDLFVRFGVFFFLAFCVVGIAIVGQEIFPEYIFPRWQVPLLERKGRVLDGEIISCTGKTTRSKRYLVTVTYRFTVRKGTKQGTFSNERPDLVGVSLPPAGTPIKVLYANRFCYIPL